MARKAEIFVGTSGWYYDHWEGVLYPKGLPKARRFAIYLERFNAVEINATYYRYPSLRMVQGWYEKAPAGFAYVVKANREITHKRKLRDAKSAVDSFYEAVAPLREKLRNVLFQLPPSLRKDIALLQDFLALLPSEPPPSFEFRHPSWECDETFNVLRAAYASHVIVSRKNYPFEEVHTSKIAYYRLHGPDQVCASSYSADWLHDLAGKLRDLSERGNTSFTFFNNDVGGHAVRNAETLNMHISEYEQR